MRIRSKYVFLVMAILLLDLSLNARYYNPDTGRFISADSATPGGGADLQRLNRYSYCDNNPVKYVDPTGHEDKPSQITGGIYILGDCFTAVLKNGLEQKMGSLEEHNIKITGDLYSNTATLVKKNYIPRMIEYFKKHNEELSLIIITVNEEFKAANSMGKEKYQKNLETLFTQTKGIQTVVVEPFYALKTDESIDINNVESATFTSMMGVDYSDNKDIQKSTEMLKEEAKKFSNVYLLPLGDKEGKMARNKDGFHLNRSSEAAFADTVTSYVNKNANIKTKIKKNDETNK